MRSRLECKWACVFDQIGWRWEYEPLDFNGWIPDFLIRTKCLPLLVEVKPILELELSVTEKIERSLGPALCRDFNVLILGAAAHYFDEFIPYQGWFSETKDLDDYDEPIPPEYHSFTDGCFTDKGGFFCYYGAWHCLITGDTGEDCGNPLDTEDWEPIWARATNATQWKAPR
jgi:hypothetical protein